jgi:hypothetical protein
MGPLALGLAVGGIQAGLGIFGAITGNTARQQEYKNQVAQQQANDRFAKWQAGFNLRQANEQSRFQYWTDTVKYNQELAYTRSLKNYELLQEVNQAELVRQTRVSAAASYINDSQAISQQAQEASMQDAVAAMQYNMAALQARARVDASGKTGQSIDLLINDYARQAGDYEAIQQMNQKFRNRQYTREQAAQVTEFLSRYNNQQFYKAKPYMEGLAPFVPLPALMQSQPPSFRGAPPSRGAMALEVGSAVLGGVQTGLSVYSGLQNTGRPAPARSGPPPP